jgi:hypothetical protein
LNEKRRPSKLRTAVLALGILYLVGAVVLFAKSPGGLIVGGYLVIVGALLIGSIVFERQRYRPRRKSAQGASEPTGERFIDPTSGRLMEVRFDPSTGAREYVDVTRETAGRSK